MGKHKQKQSKSGLSSKNIPLLVLFLAALSQETHIKSWLSSFFSIASKQEATQVVTKTVPTNKTQSKSATLSGFDGSCEANLYQGARPFISIVTMDSEAQELCFEGYAAKASWISKSNLYSAEKLTIERLSVKLKRENTFHEEPQISSGKRAELSDYKGSGFDRGHLAPNADMGSERSQYESFSLANMVPQDPEHNQHTWAKVEKITRELAKKHKEIYVVTLPVYQNQDGTFPKKVKAIGRNQVYVPNYLAKAIYLPNLQKATVVLSPNNDKNQVETISLKAFHQLSQIDVFPTLSDKIKSTDGAFFKW